MNTNLQDADQFKELAELDQADEPQLPRAVPFSAVSKVKHIQADGVYIKSTFVPANIKFYSKRTPDEHVAILAHGELIMDNGTDKVCFSSPATYTIPANTRIAFYTRTECVFYCVHATDKTNLEELDRIY